MCISQGSRKEEKWIDSKTKHINTQNMKSRIENQRERKYENGKTRKG